MPRSSIHGQPLKDEEAFLFRHYVVHVSGIMMPCDDQRNPWRSHYLAVAIHNASAEESSLQNLAGSCGSQSSSSGMCDRALFISWGKILHRSNGRAERLY
jgi:hypothetical protein